MIDGKYGVIGLLGSGAFGSVYKADDIALSRCVAVKVLNVTDSAEGRVRSRFEREAKVLSMLDHPNIVDFYAFGRDEADRPYLVMQYLVGETLAHALKKHGQLPWRRAVNIISQACRGLSAAHRSGIVHRDLNPENMMLLQEPRPDFVKLLDFGMSGFLHGESSAAAQTLTQAGTVVGTVLYVSPEVCRGMKADPRSDVYSLGCILYQSITGRLPLIADDAITMLYCHLYDLPQRINKEVNKPFIPTQLELVVFKAMQKEPSDRFQTMDEFEEALNAVLDGKHIEVNFSKIKLSNEPPSHSRELYNKLITVAAAVLITAITTFVAFHQTAQANDQITLQAVRNRPLKKPIRPLGVDEATWIPIIERATKS